MEVVTATVPAPPRPSLLLLCLVTPLPDSVSALLSPNGSWVADSRETIYLVVQTFDWY